MIRRPPRSTLFSLHDALPISPYATRPRGRTREGSGVQAHLGRDPRSEEHTSELQSQSNLVCRLLLEKKKTHVSSHEAIHEATRPYGTTRTILGIHIQTYCHRV